MKTVNSAGRDFAVTHGRLRPADHVDTDERQPIFDVRNHIDRDDFAPLDVGRETFTLAKVFEDEWVSVFAAPSGAYRLRHMDNARTVLVTDDNKLWAWVNEFVAANGDFDD